MEDNHIHIGQFNEVYYEPVEIIQIVMSRGIERLCFSSTTTCKEDVRYSEIEREISHLLAHISWSPEIVRPFFWYTPVFAGQGVYFEQAIRALPYKGIKLHPFAHQWDLDDNKILDILHKIFGYAGENRLPILIHTGHSGIDAAGLFKRFFPLYPETKFVLAHCRPIEEAIPLIRTYPNVYGDTAFLPETDIHKIIKENVSRKIMLGSDFPITNYFSNKYPSEKGRINSLADQYNSDFGQLQYFYQALITNNKPLDGLKDQKAKQA
jgi:predicted TIM-barrel fold metal-dependent hydrolase